MAEHLENESIETNFSSANEDIQVNIFQRLPATSFASAACVSKSWNNICSLILARPKFSSAISTNPSREEALKEVVDKVLSEPIRPHFAIASISSNFGVYSTAQLLSENLGSETPILVSTAPGIIGRDGNDEFQEVKFGEYSYVDADGLVHTRDVFTGIVLTVGYVPGLKVEIIPLLRLQESGTRMTDAFVTDIKNYTASVSAGTSPVGIMLFGHRGADLSSAIEKLDYALSNETVIVGYEKTQFWYRTPGFRNYSFDVYCVCDAAALVFARDRDGNHGKIEFGVALSEGVKAKGPRYTAESVMERYTLIYPRTSLSVSKEGEEGILTENQILNIYDEFRYIGITKQRNCSISEEEPGPMTSLAFHGLIGHARNQLVIDGLGVQKGDSFECYEVDRAKALTTCENVCTKLTSMKLDRNRQVVGGFIISSSDRGDSFFKKQNVDSSPFLENLSGNQFAGVFSSSEIARRGSGFICHGDGEEESSIRGCSHVCSTVYLMVLYTPSSLEN